MCRLPELVIIGYVYMIIMSLHSCQAQRFSVSLSWLSQGIYVSCFMQQREGALIHHQHALVYKQGACVWRVPKQLKSHCLVYYCHHHHHPIIFFYHCILECICCVYFITDVIGCACEVLVGLWYSAVFPSSWCRDVYNSSIRVASRVEKKLSKIIRCYLSLWLLITNIQQQWHPSVKKTWTLLFCSTCCLL